MFWKRRCAEGSAAMNTAINISLITLFVLLEVLRGG